MSTWKIIVILVSVIIGAFVAMPWREDINVLEAEVVSTETQKTVATIKQQELKEAQDLTQESPDEVISQVPRTQNQPEVIRLIEQAAEANGFNALQMSFSSRIDSALNAEVLTISLVTEGNSNTAKDFIAALETTERFLLIENINVKRANEDSNRATLSMTLNAYSNAISQ